jgi:hypothetical protein
MSTITQRFPEAQWDSQLAFAGIRVPRMPQMIEQRNKNIP